MLLRQLDRFIHGRQHNRATIADLPFGAYLVEGTTANKGLQGALVNLATIDPGAEIKDILKRATFIAGRQDISHRTLTQPLDSPQAVDNIVVLVDAKLELAQIHIRWQQLQPHGPALIDKGHYLIGFIHIRGDGCRHKLGRVVAL